MDGTADIASMGMIKSRGLRIPRNPNFLNAKIRTALRSGAYSEAMASAALRATQDGDHVLELGCGMGYLTALLAKRRTLGALHAYDGNAEVLDYAQSVLDANAVTGVTLTHGVLGARKSSVDFHLRTPFAASSLMVDEERPGAAAKVPMHNAKTACTAAKPTVILCDIEGGEADLFEVMPLKGVRQVVVKLHPGRIGQPGVARVFAALQAGGLSYDARLSAGRVVGFVAA